MSSSIWTRCAGDSELRPLRLSPWRVVESQHHLSTRKLVDSAEEQELLEDLIESSKPPAPARQHYLLSTPFRYPPLRHGSRFGTRFERGIWYGSLLLSTAFAEVAFYRLLFLEGTAADLGTVTTPHTAFTARLKAARGVDLTRRPFDRHDHEISSPQTYQHSQPLGAAMRDSGVEAACYRSARDPGGGVNVAVFAPLAFGSARPRELTPWHCTATRHRVEAAKVGHFGRETYAFERADFLVDGVLPMYSSPSNSG